MKKKQIKMKIKSQEPKTYHSQRKEQKVRKLANILLQDRESLIITIFIIM